MNEGTGDEHWESHRASSMVGFGTALERSAEERAGGCSAQRSMFAVTTAATLIIPHGGTAEQC